MQEVVCPAVAVLRGDQQRESAVEASTDLLTLHVRQALQRGLLLRRQLTPHMGAHLLRLLHAIVLLRLLRLGPLLRLRRLHLPLGQVLGDADQLRHRGRGVLRCQLHHGVRELHTFERFEQNCSEGACRRCQLPHGVRELHTFHRHEQNCSESCTRFTGTSRTVQRRRAGAAQCG